MYLNKPFPYSKMPADMSPIEKRKAKRIDLALTVEIKKLSSLDTPEENVQWCDKAILKNISFLGAYLWYDGQHTLEPGALLSIGMEVRVPMESSHTFDCLALEGYACVVRVHKEYGEKNLGIGLKFMENLTVAHCR